MAEVTLDDDVIRRTRNELDAVAARIPGLLRRADGLDVGSDVAALRTLEAWATDCSTDLSARLGLIAKLESGDYHFEHFSVTGAELRQMAGATMPVDEQLYTLDAAEKAKTDGESILSWDGAQSFGDWLEQVEAKAAKHLPLIGEHGDVIVRAFNDYEELVKIGGALYAAGTMARAPFADKLMLQVLSRFQPVTDSVVARTGQVGTWIDRAATWYGTWLSRERPWLAPVPGAKLGFVKGQIYNRLLLEGSFQESLNAMRADPSLQRLIEQSPFLRTNIDRLTRLSQSSAWARVSQFAEGAFGKPWTTTVIRNGVAEEVTFARGSTNLLRVAGAEGLTSSLKVAGGLRVLGVAGGAFATVDSGVGFVNSITSGELADNWEHGGVQGKAKVIGDGAEVLFNGSLTAAMIAPSPVTWGAVAVTGVVYGGARLVEHWDDVTHALGEAKDWAADRVDDVADFAGDVADEVEDKVGDTIDAVKDSKLNPGNWF